MREHNDKLVRDSNAMQDEIEALNRHMNLITGQNQELSAELQRFLQTDEIVKNKLNRRSVVDEIKSKVDTAIRRSQMEVEQRKSPSRPSYDQQSKTSKSYAPMQSFDRVSDNKSVGGRSSTRPYANDRTSSPLRTKSPPRSKYH